MYRIDNATAITPIPAPAAVGPNPGSFFTKGNPGTGTPATIVDDDWANAVQEELCNVITGFGVALDKTKRNQIYTLLSTAAVTRIRLTANTTFYVATTGNDANDGLAVGTPWLTIAHAISVLQKNYDTCGFTATIQLADGLTYAGVTMSGGFTGGGTVIITGNAGTPANVQVAGPISANDGASIRVQNFKITSTADCFTAGSGGVLQASGGIIFGAAVGAHAYAAAGGRVVLSGNYTIAGAAAAHWQSIERGHVTISAGITVTITGAPTLTNFAVAQIGSLLMVSGGITFAGAVTAGTKYTANLNSVINSGGNTFPGVTAGSVSTGAQYS